MIGTTLAVTKKKREDLPHLKWMLKQVGYRGGYICLEKKIVDSLQLNDVTRRLKHIQAEDKVAIPLSDIYTKQQVEEMVAEKICTLSLSINFEIQTMSLQLSKKLCIKRPEDMIKQSLKEFLKEKGYTMTTDLMGDVPRHWEIHGDLALLPSTAFTLPLWHTLGAELWRIVADSLSCTRLAQKQIVSQDGFRTPQVTLLLGDTGWVEQIDNGIRYTYDITKCMFSSGNISEKLRVAAFHCTDEVVVDLYAGIGYFTLPYLVYTGVKHLHACEWNPDAVEALQRNLVLNNVQHRCTVHAGDNRQTCPRGIADRVNLGLIPSSRPGWEPACAAFRPDMGGTLHIHYNVNTKHTAGNQSSSSEPTEAFRQEAKSCSRHSNCENSDRLNWNDIETGIGKEKVLNAFSSQTNNKKSNLKNSHEVEDKLTSVDGFFDSETSDGLYECYRCLEKRTNNTLINNSECIPINSKCICGDNDIKETHSNTGKVKSNVASSKWLPWSQGVAMEIKTILETVNGNVWTTTILHIEHVKSYAPYIDHVVLDLQCKPLNHKTISE